MMKQKRIVAVALGLALSVSPMIMLPTAFADQVSGNPSSSISARSTAPNPLDKFSTAEKAFLNNHKDEIASALGIDRFDPSTTDYFGVKESALDTIADKIPTSNTGLLKPMGAPLEIDTNAAGWLVDGKITQSKSTSGDLAYRVTIKGKKSGGTVAYTLHTVSKDASGKADPAELKNVTAIANGKPVQGFDPTKTGTWTVPDVVHVKIVNMPNDWKMTSCITEPPWRKVVFTASKDGTTVTWTFEYQGKNDDGATINPDDNAGNNSQNNNDGTTSKPPANGVSPLASTGVGIGWVGWLIGILVVIGGALGITAVTRKTKSNDADESSEPEPGNDATPSPDRSQNV